MAMRINMDPSRYQLAINDAKLEAVLYAKAVKLKNHAIAILVSRTKHTHPVTLPPAATTFKIARARRNMMAAMVVYNDDPAYFYIEFGAYLHHPTHPRILKYRPLGLGLDALNAEG